MERKFDRMEEKIDRVEASLNSIDKTLDRNTLSLEEHMRRTALLEDAFKPVQEHVIMVRGVGKTIMWLTAIISLIVAVRNIF